MVDFDVHEVYEFVPFDWDKLRGSSILVTGACGVLGSFIIRCLLHANVENELRMCIIASCRNIKRARTLFDQEIAAHACYLHLHEADVCTPFSYHGRVDYIIHTAAPTSSSFFVQQPEQTEKIIVEGTRNLLKFAQEKKVLGMVYLSSVEAMGIMKKDRPLGEDERGIINVQDPRSSYMQAKRKAEELCAVYAQQKAVPVRTARLAQILGANVNWDDWHGFAQFIRCCMESKPIILLTSGATVRSFCYVSDAIRAIFTLMVRGKNGQIYHVANEEMSCSMRELAEETARCDSTGRVSVEIRPSFAKSYYPPETYWRLDASKLHSLGWEAYTSRKTALHRMLQSFKLQRGELESHE